MITLALLNQNHLVSLICTEVNLQILEAWSTVYGIYGS